MTSIAQIVALSELLLGLSVFVQTLEYFRMREPLRSIWDWNLLREEWQGFPKLRKFLDRCLSYPSVLGVFSVRLFSAAMVAALAAAELAAPFIDPLTSSLTRGEMGGDIFSPWLRGLLLLILAVTTLLIAIRFRGTFNGGSDSMTLVVAGSLAVARFAGLNSPLARGAIALIAVQTTATYFVAGIAKLRQAEWRSGYALGRFLAAPVYAAPLGLRRLAAQRGIAFAAAWTVMIFEISMPLVWTSRELCAGGLAVTLGFHIFNAWALGLNRFIFAWVAAFPAIWYFSGAAN